MSASSSESWTPLLVLGERFTANLKALATRYPQLAEKLRLHVSAHEYFIRPTQDTILLGTGKTNAVTPLHHPVPPTSARMIAAKLYPNAKCGQSVAVGGEDLGWLWNTIYRLPCEAPLAPGHRPPLFFLMLDVERFWAILHLQDWRDMLADSRVRLFVGPDALDKFRGSLVEDVFCPWPKMSITIDAMLWPADLSLDMILAGAREGLSQRMNLLTQQLAATYGEAGAQSIAARFQSGEPLKVLGITSRYTTFLQYSMRDWLASFERLGHRTKLLIEPQDYQAGNSYSFAAAYLEFKPDLVVVIDHYRREYTGLPAEVPFVMWIQDRLPNMFSSQAGLAQDKLDFCLGYGKQECVARFNYPAARFLPSMIGINEERFSPSALSSDEIARYKCDVSFVSNASAPAQQIVQQEIDRLGSPEAARLLSGIFEQLKSVYDQGGIVTEPITIRLLIEQTMRQTSTSVPPDQLPTLVDLFTQRVNNALFRHQSLLWLADMGIDLRLYGKGWENHPQLKKFARGVADNQTQLCAIHQATAINLQVTPYGAAHQRLFDGLAAGGFFLLRWVPGETIEKLQRDVWNWCKRHNVTTGFQLISCADDDVMPLLNQIGKLRQIDPLADVDFFYAGLEEAASGDFTRVASTLWPEFDRVSYSNQQQLKQLVAHFLAAPQERAAIAESMRKRVLECHTYTAISRKLVNFIASTAAAPTAEPLAPLVIATTGFNTHRPLAIPA